MLGLFELHRAIDAVANTVAVRRVPREQFIDFAAVLDRVAQQVLAAVLPAQVLDNSWRFSHVEPVVVDQGQVG
jgi:hypothetical protein